MLNNFNVKYYFTSSFSQAWKLGSWLSENRHWSWKNAACQRHPVHFADIMRRIGMCESAGPIYVVRNCREAVFRDRYTAACSNRERPVIGNRANYLVRKVLKQMSRSYTVIPVSGDRLISPGDHNSYNISLGSLSSSTAATNLLFGL